MKTDSCVTNGAEEGTRTPTPLRVHGPEPCASANSATSAKGCASSHTSAGDGNNFSYCNGSVVAVKPGEVASRGWDYFLGIPSACARKFMMEPCTLWPMVMTGSQRSSL